VRYFCHWSTIYLQRKAKMSVHKNKEFTIFSPIIHFRLWTWNLILSVPGMESSMGLERRAPVTPSSSSRYHRRRSSGSRDERYRSGERGALSLTASVGRFVSLGLSLFLSESWCHHSQLCISMRKTGVQDNIVNVLYLKKDLELLQY